MKLKEIIASGNLVRFDRYHDGQLWYNVVTEENVGDWRFLMNFPVPISDIGNATFLAEDKAILFMRYIRKHLETQEKAKVGANEYLADV